MSRNSAKPFIQMYAMEIMPEQDFSSYISDTAQHRTSGRSPMNMRVKGDRRKFLARAYPTNMRYVAEQFGDTLPDLKKLILGHTKFQLHKPFLTDEKVDELYRYHAHGLTNHGVPIRGLPAQNALCPECYDIDMEELGYSYLRRTSLVKGVIVCEEHAVPLLATCSNCQGHTKDSDNAWRLEKHCLCKNRRQPIADLRGRRREAATAVSRLVGQTARGENPPSLSGINIVRAVSYHFRTLDKTGYQSADALENLLVRTWGDELTHRLDLRNRRLLLSVSGAHASIPAPEHPIKALSIVHTVFGDFDNFTRTLVESESENIGRNTSIKVASNPPSLAAIRAWRSWCLTAIEENPLITRSRLRNLPGYWRHEPASRSDVAWLDSKLPRIKINPNEFRSDSSPEKISALKRSIAERHMASIKNRPHKRIVATYLHLKGPRVDKRLLRDSPEIQEYLREYVDTPTSYATRCADYFCPKVLNFSDTNAMASRDWWLSKDTFRLITAGVLYTQRWLKKQTKQRQDSR